LLSKRKGASIAWPFESTEPTAKLKKSEIVTVGELLSPAGFGESSVWREGFSGVLFQSLERPFAGHLVFEFQPNGRFLFHIRRGRLVGNISTAKQAEF
jgi:hypothetical protein